MGSGASKRHHSIHSDDDNMLETYQFSRHHSNPRATDAGYSPNKDMNSKVPALAGIVLLAKKKKDRRQKIIREYPELEDALDLVHEGMLEIMANKEDDMKNKTMNPDIRQTLINIYKVYFDCYQEEHKRILVDQIAEDNGAQICADYLKVLTDNGKNTPTHGHIARGLNFVRLLCCNYSDASLEFAAQLGKMGAFPVLIADIVRFRKRLDEDLIRHTIIRASISILHNCAKVPDNKKYFTSGNALEAIIPYTKSDEDEELKMIAMMTLSYIIEEKDNDKISADGTVITNILLYLENAIDGEGHKFKGFSAYEIVSGIMHLASNDDNKLNIVRQGVLPLLVQLMQEGNEKEEEICAKTVWILSFRDENKSLIREEENMMKLLEELANSKEGETKESALGALWVLENVERLERITSIRKSTQRKNSSSESSYSGYDEEEESVEGQESGEQNSNQGHVMISYQWGCQKLMLQVKDRLEKLSYRVWIDTESMGGSTLQAMAEAVENSAVVLVCMSPKYKESPNCRTEGEYAYKLGKPLIPIRIEPGYDPDGWLGALQGAKFYVDFSDLMTFEITFSKLVRELGDKGKGSMQEGQIIPVQVNQMHAKARRMTWRKPVNNWSKDDVDKWATNNNIQSQKVRNLDGESLIFLSSVKLTAPEFFYKYSSEKLGLSELPEFISLNRGLENLEL